jgi:two-component system chemotaxis response regulator CheB
MGVVRVLVVDDSRTARTLLRSVLDADPGLTVVGEASNGAEALEAVGRLQPSVVVMDIDMPEMDGFEATKRIMIQHPTPIVIVTGSDNALQIEVSLKAVGAGALTVAPKPAGPGSPGYEAEAARLARLVKALADVKVVRQRRSVQDSGPTPAPTPPSAPDRSERDRTIEIVGVAASTGGPAALYGFLQALPRSLGVPVLVVQHIAAGFIDGLARWLSTATVLPVCVAQGNAPLQGGEVYLAPDDHHLTVRGDHIRLSTADPVGGFRPAANVLFASLAESHGAAAAAVVLTGMGDDGVQGAASLHAAGGFVLAQDADTSAVFGMPNAVVRRGIAAAVGPVDELASRVARLSLQKELKG